MMTDKPDFRCSVDWLSFTQLVAPQKRGNADDRRYDVVMDITKNYGHWLACGKATKHARRPYTDGVVLHVRDTDIVAGRAYYNKNLDHYLIEITGGGCQFLSDIDEFRQMALAVYTASYNVTRLDIATDFVTDLLPNEFVKQVSPRWKTFGTEKSETGHTEYVGSRKSDKYAKVYRYYKPHPRHDLLRVEITMKKDGGAREVLNRVSLGDSMQQIAADVNKPYGWSHPIWTFEGKRMTKSRPDNGQASTLAWLRTAVIPTIERMHTEGELPDDDPIFYELLAALPLSITRGGVRPQTNNPPMAYRGVEKRENQSTNPPTPPQKRKKDKKMAWFGGVDELG